MLMKAGLVTVFLGEAESEVLKYSKEQKEEHTRLKTDPTKSVWIPVDADWNLEEVHPWEAKSCYESGDCHETCWHLHPELVELTEECPPRAGTKLCPKCNTSCKNGDLFRRLTCLMYRIIYQLCEAIDSAVLSQSFSRKLLSRRYPLGGLGAEKSIFSSSKSVRSIVRCSSDNSLSFLCSSPTLP